jgi:hypothetical protein
VLALASLVKKDDLLASVLLISDRVYDFYTDFDLDINQYRDGDEIGLLSSFSPDYVFTGTSYTSHLELKFIKEAGKKKIATIAFIDHWTNFYSRFKWDAELILPNQVWVIDQHAKELAIGEGLPAAQVMISGNPYYPFLAQWKPRISKEEFLKQLEISAHATIIVFAPEPLSQVNGKEKFGFDELELLEKILADMPKEFWQDENNYFLIKIHPNQKRSNIESIVLRSIETKNVRIVPENIHTITLLKYADVVMGIFSNILIEADIIGTTVARYIPFKIKNDILQAATDKFPITSELSFITNRYIKNA